MIECRGIIQAYSQDFWQKKRRRVLSGLSFSLRRGETYALCGMSGAGKSTVGRVLFNEVVPPEAGYINTILTKKSLRDIIGHVLKKTSIPRTAEFLDDIKAMGYKFAFQGGLSFSLGDIIIPKEKQEMIADANEQVQGIIGNYNMGLITNNERYNQVIDVWTSTNARPHRLILLRRLARQRIRCRYFQAAASCA